MAFGPTEIVFTLVIVLLLFGGKKIPELAKGLGKVLKSLKKLLKKLKMKLMILISKKLHYVRT